MKTHNLHFRYMLSAYAGESVNPHRRLSSAWYAWEAIERVQRSGGPDKRGLTVIDAWCDRGCAVNIRTPDSVTSVCVL